MKIQKMAVAVGLVALLLVTGLSACSGAAALTDESMGALQGGCEEPEYPCKSLYGGFCSKQGRECESHDDCKIDGKACTSTLIQTECSTHKKSGTSCTPSTDEDFCGYEGQYAWCVLNEETERTECLIGPPLPDKPCPGDSATGSPCEGQIIV